MNDATAAAAATTSTAASKQAVYYVAGRHRICKIAKTIFFFANYSNQNLKDSIKHNEEHLLTLISRSQLSQLKTAQCGCNE